VQLLCYSLESESSEWSLKGRERKKGRGLEVARGARQQAVSGLSTGVGRSETKENELLLLVGGC